jgi:hypothetical protein
LTPWAAQRISDRIYEGRGFAPIVWEVFLDRRTSKNEPEGLKSGLESGMGCKSIGLFSII